MPCGNLGIANEFNLFIFNDHTQSSVDSEGRVAVGGTATYANYGVGDTLPVSTTRPDLIIQGNVNITGGTNFAGNTVIYPDSMIIAYTMTNNNRVPDQPLRGTPIDFEAAERSLTETAINLAAIPPNGTVENNFGQIVLTGVAPDLNVFTINGNNVDGEGLTLDNANGINIVAPAGSTILINVGGNNIGFGSYAIFRNGITATRADAPLILWNFFQASQAFNQNVNISGSVLAPNADWSAIGFGNIDGTLVANSLTNVTGSLEAHNVLFGGCLPDIIADVTTTTTTTTTSTTSTTTTTTTTPVPDTTTATTSTTTPVPTTTTTTEVPTTTTTTTSTTTTPVPPTTTTTPVPTTTTTSTTTPVPATTTSTTTTVSPALPAAQITAVKTANLTQAGLGDVVTFTISITNTGNAPGDIVLSEQLPRGVIYLPNTLRVDGGPYEGIDLGEDVLLGIINPGQTIIAQFDVIVISLPPGGQIMNQGNIITVSPGSLPRTCNLGERVVFADETALPNYGQGVSVLLVFKPGITPLATSISQGPLTLNNGRIILNRQIPIPGVTLPPLLGLTIPLIPGSPSPIVSPANVRIPIPTPQPQPNLVVVQRIFRRQVFLGQRLTYSVYIINNGNAPSVETVLTNLAPEGISFIPGTVRVNRTLLLDAVPAAGIPLGPIPMFQGVLVRFDVIITGGGVLTNISTITANFRLADQSLQRREFRTQPLTVSVVPAGTEQLISIEKAPNTSVSSIGSTYSYHITLRNINRSIRLENVILYDRLDAALQFVSGSLRINGTPQMDPRVGIFLGDLLPGETRNISFSVRVQFHPTNDVILNRAAAFFEFAAQGRCFRGAIVSRVSTVRVPAEEGEE
jgi:choice-of-anchor A domain-containing protein/uncharacterized repeat protein (TIGR01451 family)